MASALRDHAIIAHEMAALIVSEVGAYSRAPDVGEMLLDAERSCDAHIQNFLSSVERGTDDFDVGFTAESVAQRVRQGIPLESLLRAYRIGHHVVWTALRQRAPDTKSGRAALADLVDPTIRYIDEVSMVVAEVYLREQQHVLADADRVRRDIFEQLLTGDERALEAAGRAGIELDPDVPHRVLLARHKGERQGDLRAVCAEIARIFSSDAPLVVMRQQTATALVFGDDQATLDRARRLAKRFVGAARIRVGVSLTSLGLDAGLGEACRQAERALEVANDAEPVVTLGGMASMTYLVATADDVARALVPGEVARLASSSRQGDQALVETFRVYVASNLNVRRTAAALPAHPNTVQSRLKRLSERTGYDFRDQRDVMRLFVDLELAG